MHARSRLLDGLFREFELALALYLVTWRVYLQGVLADVFTDALLAKRLVVGHAEHVDRLIVLSANCVVTPLRRHLVHASAHLACKHLLLLPLRTVHIVAHN